jgi:Domain of unknown function (DUF6268)
MHTTHLATVFITAWLLYAATAAEPTEPMPNLYDFGLRGGPPAEVTYSFKSGARLDGAALGDLDTLTLHASWVELFEQSDRFKWLAGVDWRRIQADVPTGAPVPDTLQSTALVLGFDWEINSRWRARLEAIPGVYSDFDDFSGDDFNSPFGVEVSYAINPNLVVGVQLSVDARREMPVVGIPGVRWRIDDRWLLSLWIPRPQVEYLATEELTLFAGASLTGGSYVVADDFGTRTGRPQLNGAAVDFREVRVGGGLRWRTGKWLYAEIAGGWTVGRRYEFHEQNTEIEADGAPYVQASFGAAF